MEFYQAAESFDWDESNLSKNWDRHKVSHYECEEVFFNEPLVVAPDEKHSEKEIRYFALGKTNQGRRLFVVFTMRSNKIRVISARDMNRKEQRWYK